MLEYISLTLGGFKPSFFALYINDLACTVQSFNRGVGETILSILLYANDVVGLAENVHNGQKMLSYIMCRKRLPINESWKELVLAHLSCILGVKS